ncbi:MAG: RecX family transcriptional regulator [Myxococcota bacterium]
MAALRWVVPPSRRPPPLVTPASLDAAARDYLTRWFTTRAHLRRLLLRRVDRSIAAHGGDRAALADAIDRVLDRLAAAGALDDGAYARDKTRSLLRRGVSEAGVRQRLSARGLGEARVREALDAVRETGVDPAVGAACAYVRRRRLGPYRYDPDVRKEHRDKDLAALGRAGFSYAVARAVLDLESPADVEARILD